LTLSHNTKHKKEEKEERGKGRGLKKRKGELGIVYFRPNLSYI